MDTVGVKYIGSKREINDYIVDMVAKLDVKTAVDVFTGTTRVAQALKSMGIKVDTSDLSWASECYADAFIHAKDNSHLQQRIDEMNALAGVEGWLTKNYTGDTKQTAKTGIGRCFQRKNTMRADAARDYVDTLRLESWEKHTLITSIIFALDKVDNTVGVQQAYLKGWCKRSFNDIKFVLPQNVDGLIGKHFVGNCLQIDYGKYDLAYLDPPYSAHSYATYYHIWDSIAKWDKPETDLKARRRIDRVAKSDKYDPSFESDWNRKSKAAQAFKSLIERLDCKYILISYNDESLVDIKTLSSIVKSFGKVIGKKINYDRNIMSQIGNAEKNGVATKNQKNQEYLILIQKGVFDGKKRTGRKR